MIQSILFFILVVGATINAAIVGKKAKKGHANENILRVLVVWFVVGLSMYNTIFILAKRNYSWPKMIEGSINLMFAAVGIYALSAKLNTGFFKTLALIYGLWMIVVGVYYYWEKRYIGCAINVVVGIGMLTYALITTSTYIIPVGSTIDLSKHDEPIGNKNQPLLIARHIQSD